jgi:hypothetical protein
MNRAPLIVRVALVLAVLFAVVAPFVAFAQDGGVTAPAPIVSADDVTTITGMVRDLIGHAKEGRIALAVVAVLVLLSTVLLRFGKRLPGKVGEALASPTATWIVPQVLSVLGALGASLATGAAFSVDLLIGAVLIGLAGGGFGAKQAALVQAADAGDKAAADTAAKSKADVVAGLEKGPPVP